MRFFFDNTFPHQIPAILRLLRVDAVHLQEHFGADTLDVDWLPAVGAQGWVVVTADRRLRNRPPERAALRAADVTAVFLFDAFSRQTLWKQAHWVIGHWQAIQRAVERAPAGTCLDVTMKGNAEPFSLPK